MFRSLAKYSSFTLNTLPIAWKKPYITYAIMEEYLVKAKDNGIKKLIINNKSIERISPYIYLETIELCKKYMDNIILTISDHDYSSLTTQENINVFTNYKNAGVSAIHLSKNWIDKTDTIYSTKTNIINIAQELHIQLWLTCVLQMNGINSLHSFNEYLDWMVKINVDNVLVKQMYMSQPKKSITNISDTHINFMTSQYVPIKWLINEYIKYSYDTTYVAHTVRHKKKVIQILFETQPEKTWTLCTNGIVYSDVSQVTSQIYIN